MCIVLVFTSKRLKNYCLEKGKERKLCNRNSALAPIGKMGVSPPTSLSKPKF